MKLSFKNTIAAFAIFSGVLASAQNAKVLDGYKVVEVPAKFEVLKENDRFMMNTYTKLHLEKYGFVAYLTEQPMPEAAIIDRCDKLYADLIDDSGMFVTRLKVVFKDCNGQVVFTTAEGTSRQKDFKRSYREALGNAFQSVADLHYSYDPALRKSVVREVTINPEKPKVEEAYDPTALFAQPTANGYQLIDSKPTVIYKLQKTSSADVFIAQKGEISGTLIKKNGVWTFEYYQNGQLATESVKIRF